MRLYLNFILTVIAICLVVIVFKITDIPSSVHAYGAYGKPPVPVEIVGINSYMLYSLPVEIISTKTPLPVEVVSIKKPKNPNLMDVEEFQKTKDLKWDRISVGTD